MDQKQNLKNSQAKTARNSIKLPPRLIEHVEYVPTGQLRAYRRNARKHSKNQIGKLARGIKEFGFVVPVLADSDGSVIAGHGRILAAEILGLEEIPVIRINHLTKAQIQALRIADNRLAELAEWDDELLTMEFQDLLEVDFDLEITGFETAEIDLLIGDAAAEPDEADESPEVQRDSPAISRQGDLWQLGPHRLICADARDGATYDTLMDGKLAQMGFIDPPYNVPIAGHVCGLGKAQHPEFVMASGEMSEAEFVRFLETTLGHCAAQSIDGSIHFVCMDWRHDYALQTAARHVYTEIKNLCVWAKTNAGMGSLYRSQHELVFVFKNGTAAHINNVELGRHGRYRTNCWSYPGINSFGATRDEDLAMHPTVKPVALVADAILDCSKRGGIILDCFAGSGTTIIAAEQTGRRARAVELDPHYVDVAIRRWQSYADKEAIHAETCRSFAEIEAERVPPVVQHPSESPHVG
ncbi:MAG: ParB N-terminal domain-containing protein [Proteobacteria bacterium]|nr:ParB N-terminal domain-containing protein [Pseudomonadota bacterium]